MKLITFLGKGAPHREGNYETATYAFEGRTIATSFFGLALAEAIRAGEIVVFGTPGSMWDVFFGSRRDALTTMQRQFLPLLQTAVREERVTQDQLGSLGAAVSPSLGSSLQPRLISYAETAGSQIEILKSLDAAVAPGNTISIDITHAFRHLPMIALTSAILLRKTKRVAVRGVYYGAREMTPRERDAVTPVIRLDGLLDILDWIEAIAAYDRSGDYEAFATLLERDLTDGKAVAQKLRAAAFSERVVRVDRAAKQLEGFDKLFAARPDGIADLFRAVLLERTAWRHRGTFSERQAELARQSLARRDYLRAATLALESHISRLVEEQGDNPSEYTNRERVRKAWRGRHTTPGTGRIRGEGVADDSGWRAYQLLEDLRNALAHGTRPWQSANRTALEDESTLMSYFERVLAGLGTEARR